VAVRKAFMQSEEKTLGLATKNILKKNQRNCPGDRKQKDSDR